MPHAKVSIQHDPVHAIVAAGQQVRIPIAQRLSHVSQLNTYHRWTRILASGFSTPDFCGPEGATRSGRSPRTSVDRYSHAAPFPRPSTAGLFAPPQRLAAFL